MTPELQKRIKTAIFGVAILVLLLVFGEGIGAMIVASVLSIATLYEFTSIVYTLPDQREKRFTLLGCAWLFQSIAFWWPGGETTLISLFFLGITTYYLVLAEKFNAEELTQHYRELMATVFGFIYLGYLPTYLVALRMGGDGANWVMLFLFSVWANDVGAYFAGLKYGKKKLYAHISPGKSWEGVYGGLLASIAISLVFKVVFFKNLSWAGAVAVPVILSVISPVGDLAESFLKRAFDRKDSSSILPGHGGFLDRFDGVIFSLPVMYLLSRLF